VIVAIPAKSTFGRTVSSRDSCVANSVIASAPAATGRLRKKIDCHETYYRQLPALGAPLGGRRDLGEAQAVSLRFGCMRLGPTGRLELIAAWRARAGTPVRKLCTFPGRMY